MREKIVFFDYQVVEEAKRRANAIGVDFDGILERIGMNVRSLSSARGAYGRAAIAKGYEKEANIGIMDLQKYKEFCTAFMIEPEKYALDGPPMEKKPQYTPDEVKEPESEELLLCLEDLCRAIRANTIQITNLREQNRSEHKEALAKIPDERTAVACEEIASALKTSNRALDAIDNKLNVLVSAMQRVETKLDRGNNATIDCANKLKSVVEATSGILNKVVKICALYAKPRK